MDETMHEGGCLCGSVRFRTTGRPGPVIACHCSQCRRQTGLYYATTDVALDAIRIEGEASVSWYRASDKAARGFCGRCGSALFWRADGADRIAVMAGAFDQPSGLAMDHHIYCLDKADFYRINDGLPQYDTYPPAS
ncbi:GFA family protein [Rhizobium sp. CSW-27]|uniref:GFA family protein n=1 Tax=Rhizobium sp. CSW-27 TaxID=2839985 RepID=UPI001C01A145|nr:GFA family protein [Rhizobium sp. CSW-27]MBT9372421.1 GFA family protein [Rhizobium sp. CSW-27]